jgi:hypothetical protein
MESESFLSACFFIAMHPKKLPASFRRRFVFLLRFSEKKCQTKKKENPCFD